MKTITTISIALAFLLSCDWFPINPGPCDASGPVIVYKTKGDYHDKVSVQLSKDKNSITCYPGKDDATRQKPIELENGYLLKRMCGDTFLSISIDDYSNSTQIFSNADLLSLVLDSDPYTEKYECCECTGLDTAKINNLIRENQLGKCKNIK